MSDLIPGVLKLFSSVKYGKNKRNIPIILFKSHYTNKNLTKYFIHTREKSKKNLYVFISHHNHITGKYPRGILEQIIGPIGDYKTEIEYILCIHQCSIFNPNFRLWDKLIKKYKLTNKINKDIEYIKNLQKNECNYKVMSIDPRGCKDIDDAFHFKRYNDGYELGIHIADPSYFINDNMENIIKKRCYTIYDIPNGGNNNMLPDIYSENICSLVRGENRRAKSIIFKFDLQGNIIEKQLENSIVRNIRNFTYSKVDHLINSGKGINIVEINCIQCINFFSEYINEELNSHKFIEKLMIMANKEIGNIIINKYNKQCVIRTHSKPILAIEKFSELTEKTQDYIKLRNFKKAIYEIGKDKLHYALGIKNYVHFTSPIRRYNDIIIHKILNSIIDEKEYVINNEDIIRMNDIEKQIRKADRMRKKINLIFQLEKEHLESEIILNGTIIKIKEKYLVIYFEKYDIEERLPYKNEDSEKYKLYNCIKCRLIPFFKNESFHNKIKIELLI